MGHHGGAGEMGGHDEAEHRRAVHRAIGVSAGVLAIAGGAELGLALVTGSVGLLGDGLHNLSDVSTSALVFVGFAVSKKKPSPRYPSGYERAEDVAGLGVALVIWASAVFAGVESFRKLVGHTTTSHVGIGMLGAVLGIVANQLVARYKGRVGRRVQSATLLADARHSWLDAVSSLGALVGLVVVGLGYRLGDPIAGFAITLFIAHVGWEVTGQLLHHLMDGVDADVLGRAAEAAESVPGVLGASLSGRWTGRTLRLDVVARVDSACSVADADRLGERVQAAVFHAVDEAREVRFIPTAA